MLVSLSTAQTDIWILTFQRCIKNTACSQRMAPMEGLPGGWQLPTANFKNNTVQVYKSVQHSTQSKSCVLSDRYKVAINCSSHQILRMQCCLINCAISALSVFNNKSGSDQALPFEVLKSFGDSRIILQCSQNSLQMKSSVSQ